MARASFALAPAMIAAIAFPSVAMATKPAVRSHTSTSTTSTEVESTETVGYSFAQSRPDGVADGRTKVSVDAMNGIPQSGYYPLRVLIDNSLGPDGQMTLMYRGNVGGSVSRAIDLTTGERRTTSMMIPVGLNGGRLEVRAPGVTMNTGSSLYASFSGADASVLSIGTPTEFSDMVGRPPTSATRPDVQVLPIPVAEAPSELAGYVGYQAVVVPRATLDALSEGARRALEAYAATGGTVIAANAGRSAGEHFPLTSLSEGPTPKSYGLGHVALSAGNHAPIQSWLKLDKSQSSTEIRFGPIALENAERDTLLPQANPPKGIFLFIISLFALVIGPGSIWISRKRGPAMLLLTIPATAFASCAVMAGSSIAEDGFSLHASAHGYTILDSARHRAISTGVTAFYANLSPSAVRFDMLTALIEAEREKSSGMAIEWGDGQTVTAGFLPSRSYREWGLLSVTPTRARVIVKRGPEGVKVQNALGAKAKSLVVSTESGMFEVRDLKDGAEATASPVDSFYASGPSTQVLRRLGTTLSALCRKEPAKGQFLAELEGNGFLPTGGLTLNHHDSLQVVRGAFE